MSSTHNAHCQCGFIAFVCVGGLRATFKSKCYFPYYCNSCGIVDVNTANKNLICPKCKTTKVVAYGDKSISNYKNEEIIPSIQCFKNRAFKNGNLCPKCKNLTLTFDYADVLYD